MSNRPKFEYSNDALESWGVLDRLSRMAWESNPTHKDTVHDAAAKFHSALIAATRHLPQRSHEHQNVPPKGTNVDEGHLNTGGWRAYTIDRIAELAYSRDVGSVAEAFVKATPVLVAYKSTLNDPRAGFLFRGQVNIEWALISNLGRDTNFGDYVDGNESDFIDQRRTKTSLYELELLKQFRDCWPYMEDIDPIDTKDELTESDPSWWFRMQHYGGATRLLDVTSSISAALLFACLDWDSGEVDDSCDGVLYLFIEGMSGNIADFSSPRSDYTDKSLFCDFPEAPVFFLNPRHNERSKAQAGSFIWWPNIWEAYPGPVNYLRIPKNKKSDIARELLLMNYGPKDVVRGKKGRLNEERLRKSLGLA